MTSVTPPILVAARGNTLAGDDAFGPLVAARLTELAPSHVEVIDLGMKPAGLLSRLGQRSALIVVDAALPGPGFVPGTLIDVDFYSAGRPTLVHDTELSSHGLSIARELELARKLEILPPRVHVVAAAIVSADLGRPVSRAVSALVEPAICRILTLTRQCINETRELADA